MVRTWPRDPARDGQDWSEAFAAQGIERDEIAERVLALVEDGTPFRCCASSATHGLVCLVGWTEGLVAKIAVARSGPLERDLHRQLECARERLQELECAGARAEASPVPSIELDADGAIAWCNPAGAQLLERGVNPAALARIAPDARDTRVQLLDAAGQLIGWSRPTARPLPGGGKTLFLEDINAQIRAERDLDSFMSTLTETFAHLEQGLGIFDRDRQLTLFNPALAEMFSLDAALLARRPSLRHFLEALRQRRMLPEQRDFIAWRTRFIDASNAVGADPYCEDWPLPSGHTIRVCVRRHPRGALAFIFQDISPQVMLESRYRAEIETTQATLEKLNEPVALFGASGQMSYANPAFEQLLGLDAMCGLAGQSIDQVCQAARAGHREAESWDALRRYILSSERDCTWHALVHRHGGEKVLLRASALPDGSTLLMLGGSGDAQAAQLPEGRLARA